MTTARKDETHFDFTDYPSFNYKLTEQLVHILHFGLRHFHIVAATMLH